MILKHIKHFILFFLTFLLGTQTTYAKAEFVLPQNGLVFSIEQRQSFNSLEKEVQPNIGFPKEKTKFGKSNETSTRINRNFSKSFVEALANGVVKNLDDLKLWAKNNGLGNLTDIEIKGTFDFFDGNISFSQKALLSTKDIVSGKNINELASHFNLLVSPSAQSLTPYQARIWYSWRKSKISSLVDKSKGLESAAKEALEMRNTIRTTTRQSMIDTDIADFLNTKEVNMTWTQAMTKYNGNYNEIINASMRGRGLIDELFKIPK
jgi:hypothetical protein